MGWEPLKQRDTVGIQNLGIVLLLAAVYLVGDLLFGKRSSSLAGGTSFLFSFINGWAARSSGRGSSSQFSTATRGAEKGKL